MSPDDERVDRQLTEVWRQHRAYLVDLAFRMLGDIGGAEDVVQEAFSRLLRADLSEIEDERGWLIVVTSRLCLDQLRSARSRRERYHDEQDFDAAGWQPQPALSDPVDRVTLDDNVRIALLVVLERLSPAERVVFVLHDIFQMGFDAIAETVGRTPAACRQLASRARHRVEDASTPARFDVDSIENRRVTEKFIAACMGGDLTALLEVLDAEVVGDVDRGPGAVEPPRRVVGSTNVSRNLLRYWSSATIVAQSINGKPGALAFRDRELAGIIVLTTDAESIGHIHIIVDPRKLAFVTSQLASHG